MITLAIMVCADPANESVSRSAVEFVRAALVAGNTVERVFFYHQGCYCALDSRQVPADDYDPGKAWQELGREKGLDLVVCVGAAQRRGILDDILARETGQGSNLAAGFRLAGLGSWVEAAERADRTVRFG